MIRETRARRRDYDGSMDARPTPGTNLELKVRLDDLDPVAAALRALGAEDGGVLSQRDTYFAVASGRLKLREMPHVAELVSYERDEDERGDRWSRYTLTPVALAEVSGLLLRLTGEHGIRGVVEKVRRLWLVPGARVHLDEVAGLGSFVEIEVVNPPSPEQGQAILNDLMNALDLGAGRVVPGSYIDLIAGSPDAGASPESSVQSRRDCTATRDT
jgi:adenylate cyclase class IV